MDRDGAGRIRDPPRYAPRPLEASVADAGVPAITIQEARHSYAEVALQAGARLDVVQRQLGHASIATTARYLHESAAPAAEVADLVGTLLDGAPDDRALAVGEDRENEP